MHYTFFMSPVVKGFKKVFISCFDMSGIIVYSITIILDAMGKVDDCMEFGVIKR